MKKTHEILALLCVAASAMAGDWSWRIPVKYYQNLDFEKRDTIDKAVAAYIKAEDAANRNMSVPDVQIPLFRAAAAEWKKYTVRFDLDFDDESVKAYVLFMQGMSLKGARDRNAAMKIFEEFLDFYSEETWLAPAARFMIGECQFANGENTKARRTYLAMVAEGDDHPLSCRAYRRLAEIAWKLQNTDDAIKNWRMAADEKYKDSATSDWRTSCETLPQACVIGGKWKELSAFLFANSEMGDAARVKTVKQFEDIVAQRRWQWNAWWFDAKYVDRPGDRDKANKEIDKGLLRWHEEQKDAFYKVKEAWDWLKREYNYRKAIAAAESKKLIPEMTKCVKSAEGAQRIARLKEFASLLCDLKFFDEAKSLIPDMALAVKSAQDPERTRLAKDFADFLCRVRFFAEAHEMEQYVSNAMERLWLSYNIDRNAQAWDACILTLKQIIGGPDAEESRKGKKTLAWVYKDCTRDYEKAVSLYQEIAEPPGTLWDIQLCYRRLGKKTEAYATLQDLEFFPDQRAQAVWTAAEYYREDGNKDMAVSRYRRLLSDPELKKSQQSSWAHQRLEAWGIATGGAVIEDMR